LHGPVRAKIHLSAFSGEVSAARTCRPTKRLQRQRLFFDQNPPPSGNDKVKIVKIAKTSKDKQRKAAAAAQRPKRPRARKEWTMADVERLMRFLFKK
jgi:hypothetical protein